ncbi:hypothetical protein [Methylosinus sp. PW1]|uniref:hypothetical protein n=1 Tax=Methylosinus sp. PW1 TaxID=107636 RepID=UPI000AFC5A6D|nr:hypothetical protein [Methylosinus sp. PW1]
MIRYIRALAATMMLTFVVSAAAPIMAAAPLVVTIKTNETFARSLTVSIPSANFPLLGSFALSLKHSPSDASPAHSFSTGTGNIRVISTDNTNKKAMLALLMSQQDAATLSGNYQGDLTYTDGSRVINVARFVFQVTIGVTSVSPSSPPAFDNLAAWSPITDIFGTSDPTIVTAPGQPLAALAVQDIWTAIYGFGGNSSGASTPTNGPAGAPMLGQWWLDTSSSPYKLRASDGAQFPILATLDATGHAWSLLPPSVGYRGGVYAATAPSHEFATGIDTSGSFIFTQPDVIDLSGLGYGVASALGNAANSLNGLATFGAVQAVMANNTALSSHPTTYATAIARLGYSTLGDSSPLVFLPSGSVCSLNAGAGDGFSQVPSADGKCWLAQLPPTTWDGRWAGVDNTGSAPTQARIQVLIDALPTRGGRIALPCGFYNVASTIHIGDGNATTKSTRSGVHLVGSGDTPVSTDPATPIACVQFSWVGPADGSPTISVDGPLNGWGLEEIYLYGNNSGGGGLLLHAASDGYVRNLTSASFVNYGIFSNTYPSSNFGGHVYNSGRNIWKNVTVITGDFDNTTGVRLDGADDGSTDTAINTFELLEIHLNTTGTNHGSGLYLRVTDSNFFTGLHIQGAYGPNSSAVFFDFTANNLYPAANEFWAGDISKDPGATGLQWNYSGTPSDNLRPNILTAIGEANGGTYPTNIPKLDIGLPQKTAPDVIISGHDTTTVAGDLVKPVYSGLYRVCYYIVNRATGSAGSWSLGLGWNDGAAQSTIINSVATTVANAESDGCRTVYNLGGQTISYSVHATGVTGTPTFDLRITTERLN